MISPSVKQHAADLWSTLEPYKPHLDFAAIGALLLTLTDIAPRLTAVVTLLWVCVRFYETKTIQAWLERRRQRKEQP